MATGQDFVRQLRRDTEPLMRRITEHVFVQDTVNGLIPRDTLVRFAEQEHHYVRGIYDYFAMCVLQAPALDMKEWL
jgi:thiaminase